MTVRVFIARPLLGTVGETERVTHVIRAAEGEPVPEWMTAYCGKRFVAGELELLDGPAGMPCEKCLRRVALTQVGSPASESGSDTSDEMGADVAARLAAIDERLRYIAARLDVLADNVMVVVRAAAPDDGSTSGRRGRS